MQKLSKGELGPPLEKKETNANFNFDDEIEEQLLGESEVDSSAISAADPRLQELQEVFDELYSDLRILDILSIDYGIVIPDEELNHFDMDQDLLDLYLKQKAGHPKGF